MAVKKKTNSKSIVKEKISKKVEKKMSKLDDEDNGEAEEGESENELDIDIGNAEEEVKKLKEVLVGGDIDIDKVQIENSKPITQLKKGDKVRVDGVEFSVDAHYILIDHGKTKEMAIEIFNPKTDKDYQLRYFVDQLETSMEFYELQEIVYVRRPVKKVEW
ncbi:MAG: hypothetical protein Q7S27_03995 [Nanoarchaeota archaeon]|nr:hypothetical protein [Nanoarchaeota archaeon]